MTYYMYFIHTFIIWCNINEIQPVESYATLIQPLQVIQCKRSWGNLKYHIELSICVSYTMYILSIVLTVSEILAQIDYGSASVPLKNIENCVSLYVAITDLSGLENDVQRYSIKSVFPKFFQYLSRWRELKGQFWHFQPSMMTFRSLNQINPWVKGLRLVMWSLLLDTDQLREMLSTDQSLRDSRSRGLWSALSISRGWSVSCNSWPNHQSQTRL